VAKVPNGIEILPKILIAWIGCTNVTDRQTTDGRTTTYSEREREFTFAKNGWLVNNWFSPEKCHKVHQLITTDELCSSRSQSFYWHSYCVCGILSRDILSVAFFCPVAYYTAAFYPEFHGFTCGVSRETVRVCIMNIPKSAHVHAVVNNNIMRIWRIEAHNKSLLATARANAPLCSVYTSPLSWRG